MCGLKSQEAPEEDPLSPPERSPAPPSPQQPQRSDSQEEQLYVLSFRLPLAGHLGSDLSRKPA